MEQFIKEEETYLMCVLINFPLSAWKLNFFCYVYITCIIFIAVNSVKELGLQMKETLLKGASITWINSKEASKIVAAQKQYPKIYRQGFLAEALS